MRGNEKLGGYSFAEKIEFTIPMRGNEVDAPGGMDEAVERFTIPMRGNEFEGSARYRKGRITFTIPMRGNEKLPEGISRIDENGKVYDPHEG